jgi:hypothetical protein
MAIPSDTFKTPLTFHAFVTRVQTERLERVLQPVTPTKLYGRQLRDRRCADLIAEISVAVRVSGG